MDSDSFFAQNGLFTGTDWYAFRRARGDAAESSAEQLLRYYAAKKRIIKVRKGLYAVVQPGTEPERTDVDPFVVCMKAVDDAVVAYHAALEFHGQAYSLHQEFQFVTGHHLKPFSFQNLRFRPVLAPKALRDGNEMKTETQKRERGLFSVLVTNRERTLVDCLDRIDLAGGWEEVWRSLTAASVYDIDRIVAYAGKLDNATTASKVGFFLELNRQALSVSDKMLAQLEAMRPRQTHYLDAKRTAGKYVARWRLIVPPEVIMQQWETIR